MGYSPIGRPPMTVVFYAVDHILIDTGFRHVRKDVVNLVNNQSIAAVYLTHHHEDHSGNASILKKKFGLEIFGHPITIQKMRNPLPIYPYQRFAFGSSRATTVLPIPSKVETDQYCFHPVHTPGHSKDHTVYHEPDQGWLFSGDLYLADKIKYFRSDEILEDQINSLKKVLQLDFDSLFCAHNPKPENGKSHIRRKLEFFETFYGNVYQYWKKGISTKQIMKEIQLKEVMLTKILCANNVSAENMVQSAVDSFLKMAS